MSPFLQTLTRIAFLLIIATASMLAQSGQPLFHPTIPKVWDDDVMRDVELPLAAHVAVHHMPADYYYRIPVRPNVKT